MGLSWHWAQRLSGNCPQPSFWLLVTSWKGALGLWAMTLRILSENLTPGVLVILFTVPRKHRSSTRALFHCFCVFSTPEIPVCLQGGRGLPIFFGQQLLQFSLVQGLMALAPKWFIASLHTLATLFLRSMKPFPFPGRILSLSLVQQARTSKSWVKEQASESWLSPAQAKVSDWNKDSTVKNEVPVLWCPEAWRDWGESPASWMSARVEVAKGDATQSSPKPWIRRSSCVASFLDSLLVWLSVWDEILLWSPPFVFLGSEVKKEVMLLVCQTLAGSKRT